jgi:hypothetical protein
LENNQIDLYDLFSDQYVIELLEESIQNIPERIYINLNNNQRKRIEDLAIRWVDFTSSSDYRSEAQTALGLYISNLNTVLLNKQNIEKRLSSENSKKNANDILFMIVYHEMIHAIYPRANEQIIQCRTKKWLESHIRELQVINYTSS